MLLQSPTIMRCVTSKKNFQKHLRASLRIIYLAGELRRKSGRKVDSCDIAALSPWP